MQRSRQASRIEHSQSRNSRKSDFLSGASRWSKAEKPVEKNIMEDKSIIGTNFALGGMGQINNDQGELESMIVDLNKKFIEVSG